jgi:GNAT superfamily N-acetyltransferase
MPLTVRRLGPGDEPVLTLLAAEAPEFDVAGRTAVERPLKPEDAARYLAEPTVLHWVAEEDGRVVGELLCHSLLLPSESGRELLLYSIGVRESHRRRGVGRVLLDEMLGWARAERIPEIWVLADNPSAEAFYSACGFVRGGENDQGVLMTLAASVEPA